MTENTSREARSLYPVSKRSTRLALQKAIGGRIAREVAWDNYLSETRQSYPSLWSGVSVLADFRARTALIAESSAEIGETSFLGGALIYFAAVKEQAEYAGSTLAYPDEAKVNSWLAASTGALLTAEESAAIATIMHNETTDEDLKKVRSTSLHGFQAMQAELVAKNAPSLANSAFFEQTVDLLTTIATKSVAKASAAALEFRAHEQQFVSTMQEWHWNDMPPAAAASAIIGASDMRNLLQMPDVG